MIIFPTCNMNGTDPVDLVTQMRAAYDAIDNALEAMGRMTPHGRDYQIGEHSYSDAIAVHHAQVAKLQQVKRHIREVVEKVVDQPAYAKANSREIERRRREWNEANAAAEKR